MRKMRTSNVLLLLMTILLYLCTHLLGNNEVQALYNDNWEYRLNPDNSITITKNLGKETIVQIPDSIDGKIVTRLEGYEYTSIKDFVIPSTVEYIDTTIFYRGLPENIYVDINNNHYKSVEGVLFTKNMEKLLAYPMGNVRETYQIPLGVKIIASGTFATTIYNGETALKTIEIPSSVTSIEDIHSLGARMANINVHQENETYKSTDGILFNKSGAELLCYPYANNRTEYSVPEGTKKIQRNAFYSTYGIVHYIKNLSLPASLEAFPNSFDIEKLQNIYVHTNNPNFTSVDGVLFSKNMELLILYPMGNLRSSYVIPSGVNKIGYDAFYDIYQYPQDSLKDITIPASLLDPSTILLKGWENIFVDESHPTFKSIDGVLFSKDGKTLVQYPRLKPPEIYSVPKGTQFIKPGAFSYCLYLNTLILPNSIESIGQDAISMCEVLSNVVINNSNLGIGLNNFSSRNPVTIWSSIDSAAQTYAREHNLVFKELVVPTKPVVNEVTEHDTVVSGLADSGMKVTVKMGTTVIGSSYVSSDGQYSMGIEKQLVGTKLIVTVTNQLGIESEGKEVTVLSKDIYAPAKPEVNRVMEFDTVINGTAEARTKVTVRVGMTEIGSSEAGPEGKFSIEIEKQSSGTKLVVTAIDATGNKSEETVMVVEGVDTKVPANPEVFLVSELDTVVYGKAEAGALVMVKTGTNKLGSSIAGPDGQYKIEIEKQSSGTKLVVTAIDAAGNESEETVVIVVSKLDVAPAKPLVNKVTEIDTMVTGEAEAGIKVFVNLGTKELGSSIAGQDDQFSIVIEKQPAGTKLFVITRNNAGKESERTEVTVEPEKKPIDECFIATAAYGTKFSPAVELLRDFRDQFLLCNKVGQVFVDFYYKKSPKIAQVIADDEILKFVVRILLLPAVGTAYLLIHPLMLAVLLVLIGMVFMIRKTRMLTKN
jgi:hypothetical protein